MAREKPPDPLGDDVPAWVMTFSDVITLLMTFFILLLTFASSEPETFERMQVAVFGGGGASGIAGKIDSTVDKDTIVMRERPRSARLSQRGSEMPPTYTDPSYESMAKGIAGLEQNEERQLSDSHVLKIPLAEWVDERGEFNSSGQNHLRMLVMQMRKLPLTLDVMVNDEAELKVALKIADEITDRGRIPLGRVSVGYGVVSEDDPRDVLLLVLTLEKHQP